MLSNTWSTIKSWYAQPFSTSMTGTDWFLFIGLLLVIMGAWRVILSHIQE